jgi:putative heme iron utilization protein
VSAAAVPSAAPRTPSHAERCRTLLARARHATLSTISREPKGFPFGSLVSIACDGAGRPLLLLSALAEHTQNLHAAPEASILVSASPADRPISGVTPLAGPASTPAPPAPAATPGSTPSAGTPRDRALSRDQLAFARATLVGPCAPIGEEGAARAARDTFLAAHPEAAGYASFRDFAMYRLEPVAVRYVGGFGRMSWVSLADYLAASPDPLAGSEATIVEHMNDDHPDATLAYARTMGGIPNATRALMTAIDRYGFELLAVTSDGEQQVRIPFEDDVTSPDAARRALVALVRAARAALTHA